MCYRTVSATEGGASSARVTKGTKIFRRARLAPLEPKLREHFLRLAAVMNTSEPRWLMEDTAGTAIFVSKNDLAWATEETTKQRKDPTVSSSVSAADLKIHVNHITKLSK